MSAGIADIASGDDLDGGVLHGTAVDGPCHLCDNRSNVFLLHLGCDLPAICW